MILTECPSVTPVSVIKITAINKDLGHTIPNNMRNYEYQMPTDNPMA